MERELNSVFNDGDTLLRVIERPDYDPRIDTGLTPFNGTMVPITPELYNACLKCFYFRKPYCKTLPIRGECSSRNREDEKRVIFIKIN